MNLYDYCKEDGFNYDTHDNVFDMVVTVCVNPEEPDEDGADPYNDFVKSIMKRVEVVSEDDITPAWSFIVAWSSLIQNNLKEFRAWTNENWIRGNYKDDDDYICEWISQIHLLFAGYGTDADYRIIHEFLEERIPEV